MNACQQWGTWPEQWGRLAGQWLALILGREVLKRRGINSLEFATQLKVGLWAWIIG